MILDRLPIRPGVDELMYTPGAVVWRVDRENVGRSQMNRIVGTPLYKKVTIRSAKTMRKLNELTATPKRLPAAGTKGIGGSNAQTTDAAGAVWQTRSIAESVATVSIYTMLFAVALSAVKLIQALVTAPGTSAHEATSVTRGVLTAAR